MKKLTYTKQHKLSLITEELFAAFPAWVNVDSVSNELSTSVSISGEDSKLTLWVPDDANENAIQVVIDAHDSSKESEGEKITREHQEARISARAKFKIQGMTDREVDVTLGEQT